MRFKLLLLAVFALPFLRAERSDGAVRIYQVRAVLQSYDGREREARIAHEEIPLYMPAMTMSFKVKGKVNEEALHPGDCVQFALHVSDKEVWIDDLQKNYSTTKWPFRVDQCSVTR